MRLGSVRFSPKYPKLSAFDASSQPTSRRPLSPAFDRTIQENCLLHCGADRINVHRYISAKHFFDANQYIFVLSIDSFGRRR